MPLLNIAAPLAALAKRWCFGLHNSKMLALKSVVGALAVRPRWKSSAAACRWQKYRAR